MAKNIYAPQYHFLLIHLIFLTSKPQTSKTQFYYWKRQLAAQFVESWILENVTMNFLRAILKLLSRMFSQVTMPLTGREAT